MIAKLRLWATYLKVALSSILYNRLIYAISVGTIAISLLILGAFVLLSVNVRDWIQGWGQTLSISVYLKDGIDEGTRERIRTAVSTLQGAEIKGFISKEKALQDMKGMLGSQAGLLDGLTWNPLPASFEVAFKNVDRAKFEPKRIKEALEKVAGVDEVQYSEQWLDQFEGLLYVLKIAGFALGGLLCVAVLFIITNTIKLAIYSRRNEIEIYKLVGATDWYVKAPLLIEGALQGALGALIALVILSAVHLVLSFKAVQVFGLPFLEFVFLSSSYALGILFLGLVLGLLGSFIAIGRFFKF
ncbi:MAG: cell division protein [Deltaproteobacteria bacterium]|jgi:cell division transport system permease protein|nr:cell division protein [Deltaproteobacteria bacterium]